MSLDTTRLIALSEARQAVNDARLLAIQSGVLSGITTDTTPTVIGSIAIPDATAGILQVYCTGLDDSLNAFNIVKTATFKLDGTLSISSTDTFAPTPEVTASLAIAANGSNIDITVTGTGNMNWKASYLLNGVTVTVLA